MEKVAVLCVLIATICVLAELSAATRSLPKEPGR
jgi:hypothetical protein